MTVKRAKIGWGPQTASRRCWCCPDDATHLVRTANGVRRSCAAHVERIPAEHRLNVTEMRNAA